MLAEWQIEISHILPIKHTNKPNKTHIHSYKRTHTPSKNNTPLSEKHQNELCKDDEMSESKFVCYVSSKSISESNI